MPIRLPSLSSEKRDVEIGTKAEFMKLQLKHAIVGSDSDDIRSAVEKIEKMSPAAYGAYVRPHDTLTRSVKAFKAKYAKKHPKFISAVEADFVTPVDNIIENGKDWVKEASDMPRQFLDVLVPLDEAVDVLTSVPLDDAKLRTAEEKLTAVGSLYMNALQRLSQMERDFGIVSLKQVKTAGEAKRPLIHTVDRILQGARSGRNYNFDLKPVVFALSDLGHTCKVMAEAVAKTAA